MRILYDGDIYKLQVAGGITRYFESLISRLPEDFDVSLLVGNSINSLYPPRPSLKILEYNGPHQTPGRYGLGSYYSRLRSGVRRVALAKKSFDVCHPTYYTRVSREEYRCPTVITVWDMIHELLPAGLDPNGEFAAQKKKAITAAQRVICISENTKRDLLERCRIPEDKVSVTHLAPELDETMSHGPEIVPSRPYYLYVGSRAGYKNFDRLLKSFARVVTGSRELALCIVGSPLNDDEKTLTTDLKLSDHIEFYGQITDRHLAKLYRCSIALVYPSLYEGFGLPPLEAMACGTVAVASNVASIPEVVGNAAVLFDPTSEDELIDILRTLPEDKARREELIARGKRHVRKFTWEQTVAQTIDVYRAAVG